MTDLRFDQPSPSVSSPHVSLSRCISVLSTIVATSRSHIGANELFMPFEGEDDGNKAKCASPLHTCTYLFLIVINMGGVSLVE